MNRQETEIVRGAMEMLTEVAKLKGERDKLVEENAWLRTLVADKLASQEEQ